MILNPVTYGHGSGYNTIPGTVAVSVGTNPHQNSPFYFTRTCNNIYSGTPASTTHLRDMMRNPSYFRSSSKCSQPIQDLGVLSAGLELVCFSTIDPNTKVASQTPANTYPHCGYNSDVVMAAPVKLTNVNAQQDINIAVSLYL